MFMDADGGSHAGGIAPGQLPADLKRANVRNSEREGLVTAAYTLSAHLLRRVDTCLREEGKREIPAAHPAAGLR